MTPTHPWKVGEIRLIPEPEEPNHYRLLLISDETRGAQDIPAVVIRTAGGWCVGGRFDLGPFADPIEAVAAVWRVTVDPDEEATPDD